MEILELDPTWQGRGIGGAIIDRLIERARRTDRSLGLAVLGSNRRARAFYERHGLNIISETPDEIRMSTRDDAAQ